jgi:cytosine/adenosine deaminase-related metal-dependent hydrolase
MRAFLIVTLTLFCSQSAWAKDKVDILIHNARIVTMDEAFTVFENGVLAVKGDKIVAVGDGSLKGEYKAKKTIDASGDILMPGMISLHNHTAMVAFRGVGEYNVDNLLFDVMFPLEQKLLDRELIYVASRHAAMELALGGVTLVTDMYYHEDEVAKGTKDVGIRGVLGETVIGFPVVDAPEAFGGLAYAEAFIKEYKNDPLIIPAVAPHAPYTVSPEMLRKARALSEKYDVPMVMHMAEFGDEKALIQERFDTMEDGESIIEYLDRIGALHERLLGAHVIELDASDIALLKKRGVGVGHNPKANIKGGQNLAPAWEMYKAGLGIGLGTDGPMSSNQLDTLNVMGYAARVARMKYQDTKAFTPRELVELATIGGARALDLEDRIGSLESGKLADFVILDGQAPNMQPSYDVYATIAHQAYAGNVETVVVNGAFVVKDKTLVNIKRRAHDKAWQKIMDRVSAFRETLSVEPQP